MKKIIINADDLGLSPTVNKKIEDCIKRGVITSSTLIANAPAFDDGVRIAKQYPYVSVGAHLNLIEFAPLTNIPVFKKYGIVNEEGEFIEGAIYCAKFDEILKKAIFEEWDAQISRIKEAGVIPSHCDSHQHTHTIDALQEVLSKVMKKHGICKVRRKIVPSVLLMIRGRKRPSVKFDKSKAIMPPKRNVIYRRFHLFTVIKECRSWNKRMRQLFITTNSFYAFNSFYYDLNYLHFGGRDSVIELMCHPGLAEFEEETNNLLKYPKWLPKGYELISYNELS